MSTGYTHCAFDALWVGRAHGKGTSKQGSHLRSTAHCAHPNALDQNFAARWSDLAWEQQLNPRTFLICVLDELLARMQLLDSASGDVRAA